MQAREKIFLSTIVLAILLRWCASSEYGAKNLNVINNYFNHQGQNCSLQSINFLTTDNKGNYYDQGANYVIIFNPKAKDLDFKVNLGLSHKLYAKEKNKLRQEYAPKLFRELISDENSTLNGKPPIAAINADYIGVDRKPQGLNISRGVEYSGKFKDKRSSFGISGGKPQERVATIQIGKRDNELLNYNLVGGNGRFYEQGKFKDICPDLGDYVCARETSRSMVAITSKGYVILLVNNASFKQFLYTSMFDDVLTGIANNYCLGKVQEGMLFDGGFSTGFYINNRIYAENFHPVGSVFLIYRKK
jgi:hypothetical protein